MVRRKFGVLLILICFAAMSCAWGQTQDKFAYTTYGVLSTSLNSYKVVNGIFTSMRATNQISDSAWIAYASLANKFLDEHIVIDKAMADYKNGTTTQSQVEALVPLLNSALKDLTDYYYKQIPADKQKPLI